MRTLAISIPFVATLLLGTPAHALAAPSVSAQATAGANGLALEGMGSASTHIVKVADVLVSTDAANGCTLSITSGSLTKAGGTPIAFQVVLVADGVSPPSASEFPAESGTAYTFATTAAGTVAKDLYIKYLPASLQDPGPYTASIALNVVNN